MKLTHYLLLVDSCLSRTQNTRVINSGVSESKRALTLDAVDLVSILERNRDQVANYICSRSSRTPKRPGEFLACLLSISEISNQHLLSDGAMRQWQYEWSGPKSQLFPQDILPENIWSELIKLDNWVVSELLKIKSDELLIQLEWEIGIGPLHPFYDACGRVSRYISTLVRLWLELDLPIHEERSDYMEAANKGIGAFQEYFRNLKSISVDQLDLQNHGNNTTRASP